jgi:hypothetical protein
MSSITLYVWFWFVSLYQYVMLKFVIMWRLRLYFGTEAETLFHFLNNVMFFSSSK